MIISRNYPVLADRLSLKYAKLWAGAEILLFVLVGATVDLKYAIKAGIPAIIIVFVALIFRMFGVYICLVKTRLTKKEENILYDSIYTQSNRTGSDRSNSFSMGLACGQQVLTVSVLSILITALFGAIGIDSLYTKLLKID